MGVIVGSDPKARSLNFFCIFSGLKTKTIYMSEKGYIINKLVLITVT